MKIDAHQHFWEIGRFDTSWLEVPEHRPIHRSFLPADLKPLLDAAGIAASVFVQTQHSLEENRWALKLADQDGWIAGVVGWIDLAGAECEEQLLEMQRHPKFVGVRHIVQGEPDVDFVIRPAFLRGLEVLQKHNVPYDFLCYPKQLHHAATLARLLPELRIVIDHLGKPHIRERRLDDWEANFRAAAKFPNVFCKLSGMVTEADWKTWQPSDLKLYVDIALDAFGPSRLMYGSDWPVCLLAGEYPRVVAAFRERIGSLSASEREQIEGGTAQAFYGLKTL